MVDEQILHTLLPLYIVAHRQIIEYSVCAGIGVSQVDTNFSWRPECKGARQTSIYIYSTLYLNFEIPLEQFET